MHHKMMPVTRKGHIFWKCRDKNRLSRLALLPVLTVPWRPWWKAEHSLMFLSALCGWSHGGPFDYSGIIFWLRFNMALLRESLGISFFCPVRMWMKWLREQKQAVSPSYLSQKELHVWFVHLFFFRFKLHIFGGSNLKFFQIGQRGCLGVEIWQ